MNQAHIYQLSLAIVGLWFAGIGVWRLSRDGLHTSSVLMLIGGVILLCSIGYSQYSNINVDSPPQHVVWLTALGAILSTVGALIVLFG